jgi:hypothetical protein
MIVGFVNYLTLNGVDASKVTLLTFYNGQRKRLLREIHGHQNCDAISAVKVVTVDGYQGTQFLLLWPCKWPFSLTSTRRRKRHRYPEPGPLQSQARNWLSLF